MPVQGAAQGRGGQPGPLDADGDPKIGDIGLSCPKLGKGHGTWYFYFEAERGEGNKRARVRRGGFAKLDDAEKKVKKLYDAVTAGTDVLSDETCATSSSGGSRRRSPSPAPLATATRSASTTTSSLTSGTSRAETSRSGPEVQEKLGHSSRQSTSDTYTSVLPEMMRAEAESVSRRPPTKSPSRSALR